MKHAYRAAGMDVVFTAAVFFLAGCGGNAGPDVPVTGITLSIAEDDEQVLQVGGYLEIAAAIAPSDATDTGIVWRSLRPKVALVLGNGLTVTVLGVTPGETEILAVTEDGGFSARCVVKVEQ